MDGVFMNGKTIKVVEYNLSFGANDRTVHILGLFRYKANNNMYVIYSDVDIKYNIIYYGSSHIKETSILSMACKEKQEEEIIKEYIFKVINQEPLDNFEVISLENIDGVEIISSNKIEVKPEVLYQLVEKTIPKPKEEIAPTTTAPQKKKSSKKVLLIFLFIILLGVGGYLYLNNQTPKDNTGKIFTCAKTYQHETLNAKVEEENTYYFNYQDNLEKRNINTVYQFLTKEDYQNFIKNGTMYKYMPEDTTNGGWDKNDTEYWFKIMTNEAVTSSYTEPKTYEEAYNYYKNKGYTCNETIEKE